MRVWLASHLCLYHFRAWCLQRPQEGSEVPETGITGSYKPTCWCRESNPGLLLLPHRVVPPPSMSHLYQTVSRLQPAITLGWILYDIMDITTYTLAAFGYCKTQTSFFWFNQGDGKLDFLEKEQTELRGPLCPTDTHTWILLSLVREEKPKP